MDLDMRAMTEKEDKYTFSNSTQISMQCGLIGHLRADMDTDGNGFFSSWEDYRKELKTDEFKDEFDKVINSLREEGDILYNRKSLAKYCYSSPQAKMNNEQDYYGVRVDTEKYAYLCRLNPNKGEYNLYCYDGDMPKYGAVRSTNSDFKRDLTGSDKRFSFFIPAESKTQTVHLFESAIDLLSYATLELRHGQSRHDDLLSLAGVYKTENKQDIPLALKTYLDRHKETKVIYLHLDNDEVGRTATRQITDALSAEYTVIDQPPQSGKDFNDFLKNEIQKKRKEQVR